MNLTDPDPETGGDNWGCPRLSLHGAGWLIDWYDAKGYNTGASVAKGAVLEWINKKPGEVMALQVRVSAWLASKLQTS